MQTVFMAQFHARTSFVSLIALSTFQDGGELSKQGTGIHS